MEKVYLNPNGSFPWHDGKPNLITQSDFEDCCCKPPAPRACACSSWRDWPHPRPTFPCSGLLESYSLDSWFEHIIRTPPGSWEEIERRLTEPVIVTALTNVRCRWDPAPEAATFEERLKESGVWGPWEPLNQPIEVRLFVPFYSYQPAFWDIYRGSNIRPRKYTGLSPIGSYYRLAPDYADQTVEMWATIS